MPLTPLDASLVSRTMWVPTVCAGIAYDFRYPPSRLNETLPPQSSSILKRLATQNLTLHMKVSFDPFPGIHYDVDVSSVDGGAIAVGTVLHSLYEFLRSHLSPNDLLNLLSLPYQSRFAIHHSFVRRVKNSENPVLDAVGGYQFIDLLCGDTVFRGLVPGSGNSPTQWRLVLFHQWIARLSAYHINNQRPLIQNGASHRPAADSRADAPVPRDVTSQLQATSTTLGQFNGQPQTHASAHTGVLPPRHQTLNRHSANMLAPGLQRPSGAAHHCIRSDQDVRYDRTIDNIQLAAGLFCDGASQFRRTQQSAFKS